MLTIVLIIHVFIVIALVGVVLLQRSDGGALGIGGGGGGGAGGFMSGRGAANALTRTTTILAALFFTTSMGLAIFGPKPVETGDIARELTGDDGSLLGPASGDDDINPEDLLEGFGDTSEEAAEDDLLSLPVGPEETEPETAEEPDSDPGSDEPQ